MKKRKSESGLVIEPCGDNKSIQVNKARRFKNKTKTRKRKRERLSEQIDTKKHSREEGNIFGKNEG